MTNIFFDKFSRTPDYESNILEIENIEFNYLIIKMTRPDNFYFESGQYIPIYMKDNQGEFQFCYSIASSAKNKKYLELCIQITGEGRGVKFWKNLSPNDNIYFDKAKGNFKIIDLNVPIFLFAGGSGISPVRSLLLDMFENNLDLKNNIHLIYACKKAEAFSFENDFIQLSKKHASFLKVHFIAEEGNFINKQKGNILLGIENLLSEITINSHFYICGSPGMVNAVWNNLLDKNVSPSNIFKEF